MPDHNEIFSNVIDQHVDALYNFTRREIAYHIATGDLLPDVITADGVVAAVVWRAQREFAKQPDGSNIRAWLIGLALEEVDLEVTRSKRVRERTTRVANDQPDTLPADVAFALGDEIPDFFQPDPDVPTKGFVARTSQATPEQTLAADQRGRLIIRVLRALRAPTGWPSCCALSKAWQSMTFLESSTDPSSRPSEISNRCGT